MITVQSYDSSNVFGNYTIWVNEINDSNLTRDKWEELGMLYYKVPALLVVLMKWYNLILKYI